MRDLPEQVESVVYIIDGKKKWWTDRRVKMGFWVGILIGLLVGLVAGQVLAILQKHEILVRATPIYRELIIRGDAAMAMLTQVGKELDKLGQGKKVVLADDLKALHKRVDVGTNKIVVSE